MHDHAILLPTIAMAGLIWVVWASLFAMRRQHMKKVPPTEVDFKDGISAMKYFQPVEMPANNLRNLVEMPILFFALVPLLMFCELDNVIQIMLAWSYVFLRAWHSFEHIVTKNVQRRFLVYVGSCAVLLAMWIGFAVDLGLDMVA